MRFEAPVPTQFRNNIVSATASDQFAISANALTSLETDFNIYSPESIRFLASTELTLEEWRAAGFDTNTAITSDVVYENATPVESADFELLQGSVAVDFCPLIDGTETDFFGRVRDDSPDAGALERIETREE